MAFNLSKAKVIGRLGDAPKMGNAGGKATANCRVCANFKRGTREVAVWYSFTLWEKLAEAVGPKMQKGDMIYVDGDLELETYVSQKDGVERQSMKIHVDQFILLSDTRGREASEEQPRRPPPPARNDGTRSPFGGDEDNEIPF